MNSIVKRIKDDFSIFVDSMTEQGFLLDMNPLTAFESKNGTLLSWSSTAGLAYLFTDYANIAQYVELLQRRDFSLCLIDGGLIQIEYRLDKDGIIGHRLCYTPCPFEYKSEDWEGISLADIPYLLSEKELLERTRLASPFRFDFDINFSDEKHAHAHVSVNRQTCRIPAYGPISLAHFLRFVMRYFQEEMFDSGSWWTELSPKLYTRTLPRPVPHELYIESVVGYE